MSTKTFLKASFTAFLLVVLAVSAHASVTLAGGPYLAVAATARGASASAFDPINQVYLVVTAHGQARGRFTNAQGVPIGAEFVIQSGAGWAHFPRVAFSPHADSGRGGFLVTWHESVPSPIPHARIVSYLSGPMGTAIPLTAEGSAWETTTPAVAYSTVSQVFLVVWENVNHNRIRGAIVNNAGAQVGAMFSVAESSIAGYGVAKPTVTYNPATNEFLAAWSGWSTAATVDAQRVSSSGALIGAAIPLVATAATYQVDATYNPHTNQFLIGWGQNIGGFGGGSYGRVLNADGSYSGNVIPFSTRFGTTDSFSVAYNTVSQSFLMAAMDSLGPENGGTELVASGNPVDAGFLMTATGNPGNWYPRLSASTIAPEWIISSAHNFVNTYTHRLVGAGGGQPPPPPPPTKPPNPMISLDVPSSGAVSSSFAIAGWAVDTGATSGTGVDQVHAYAFSVVDGSRTFLGAAALGISRPDIGAWLGAQFANAGYGLTGTLPPGTYDINTYSRSTVTGLFQAAQVKRITIIAPVSNPMMWVDLPSENQVVTQTFTVAGWAVDIGSPTGVGVSGIHMHAFPVSGGPSIFLGAGSIGYYRADIAAFLGARFGPSAYILQASLPPGEYNLVVFAWSDVARTFNNWKVVRIRVV